MNNASVLGGGKCPPGWDPVSGTCYMYVGAPMTYSEARKFCSVSRFQKKSIKLKKRFSFWLLFFVIIFNY